MKITKLEPVFSMSNVRGSRVVNPHKLNFSFYFSGNDGNKHSIRVKPIFDPEHMRIGNAGTLELSGNWNYIPGKNDKNVSSKQITIMKKFFKNYIVIFCLVWEGLVDETSASDYFEGYSNLHDFISSLDFYDSYKNQLDNIHDIKSLEAFCRSNNVVNMYGN